MWFEYIVTSVDVLVVQFWLAYAFSWDMLDCMWNSFTFPATDNFPSLNGPEYKASHYSYIGIALAFSINVQIVEQRIV